MKKWFQYNKWTINITSTYSWFSYILRIMHPCSSYNYSDNDVQTRSRSQTAACRYSFTGYGKVCMARGRSGARYIVFIVLIKRPVKLDVSCPVRKRPRLHVGVDRDDALQSRRYIFTSYTLVYACVYVRAMPSKMYYILYNIFYTRITYREGLSAY